MTDPLKRKYFKITIDGEDHGICPAGLIVQKLGLAAGPDMMLLKEGGTLDIQVESLRMTEEEYARLPIQ